MKCCDWLIPNGTVSKQKKSNKATNRVLGSKPLGFMQQQLNFMQPTSQNGIHTKMHQQHGSRNGDIMQQKQQILEETQ